MASKNTIKGPIRINLDEYGSIVALFKPEDIRDHMRQIAERHSFHQGLLMING
jgi:hypothetical protein